MTDDEPGDMPAAELGLEETVQLADILRAAGRHSFGPEFFLVQLRAFARERCPDPTERLPQVDLWLAGGEVVTVCHVIAVAAHWVAVAARDPHAPEVVMAMRTELLPYGLIVRVTISGGGERSRGIGFDRTREPTVIRDERTPEEALLIAAGLERAT